MSRRHPPSRRHTLGVALWASAWLAVPAAAHNGALGVAMPVQGIVIDGDFGDWPPHLPSSPMRRFGSGRRPTDAADLQARLRVGYDSRWLYLAVEVDDESTVVDTSTGATWQTQDGCEVYLSPAHGSGHLVQYGIRSDRKEVTGPGALTDFDVATAREPHGWRYEWRLRLERQTAGAVIALNVAICDRDADHSLTWMLWGDGDRQRPVAERLGDLALVAGPAALGLLHGRLEWADGAGGVALGRVAVASKSLQGELSADSEGRWQVPVPSGVYDVRVAWPAADTADHEEITVAGSTRVDLTAPLPTGSLAPVGHGRGHWETFGVPQGLINRTVYTGFQDRDGYLWFGTEGGVSRFDGQQFRSFTEREGLVRNWVRAIAQDRQGNLWFGTEDGGASRFDGVSFQTFTADDGLAGNSVRAIAVDRDGSLWFGTDGGVSRFDGVTFVSFTADDGLAHNDVRAVVPDEHGVLWLGTEAGVSRFDGRRFQGLHPERGPDRQSVWAIAEDYRGHLWFGDDAGVMRFDGERLTRMEIGTGVSAGAVWSIVRDHVGNLWMGTVEGGVSRYDGTHFTALATAEGLPDPQVRAILEDDEGNLWFGTGSFGTGEGVVRYSGNQIATFTSADGLPGEAVYSILEDRQGDLWFGSTQGLARFDGQTFQSFVYEDGFDPGHGPQRRLMEDADGGVWYGASRFDGKRFTTMTQADGLVRGVEHLIQDRNGTIWASLWAYSLARLVDGHFVGFTGIEGLQQQWARSLLEDRHGTLWIGTWHGGVVRWDGRQATSLTEADGLGDDGVFSLFEDRDGHVWLGTWTGGVSRWDGRELRTWTMAEGLAGNWVTTIAQDRDGNMLFGTLGGGVSLFDGLVMQTLSTLDGLAHDVVWDLHQDRRGDIWIATEGGLTRYRPLRTPPPIELGRGLGAPAPGHVDAVTSDDVLVFEFHGRSFKSRPGQLAYLYRLVGLDDRWRPTREERVELPVPGRGDYVFEVKAVDRDLTHSVEPARATVSVHLPYGQYALLGGLGISLIAVALSSVYGVRRRHERDRAREQLLREQAEELQTAQELQRKLMPSAPPDVERLGIAGRCVTATLVGGDFFKYYTEQSKVSVAIADVTGHAMKAAIPVVMFSGILDNMMETGGRTLTELLGGLNRALLQSLGANTFVCFTMVQIDTDTWSVRLANCGCPYALHFRAGAGVLSELELDGYPLGVSAGTDFRTVELTLQAGDYLVLYSDGIPEASNEAEESFGYDAVAATVKAACQRGATPPEVLAELLEAAHDFTGPNPPHTDDMTCVVLRRVP